MSKPPKAPSWPADPGFNDADERLGYLYMLEFINGKKYIGITRQTPDARYTTHKAGIKTRKQLIHKAWAKHRHCNGHRRPVRL